MMRKISVALASYNGDRFIGEQLDSILHQTCSVNEIVICDDCSSDDTVQIAREYEMKYPEIEWYIVSNAFNLGYSHNFRKAIGLCTGDVIFLCDQDDVWAMNKVERTMDVFDRYPNAGGVLTNFISIDEKGNRICPDKYGENIWAPLRSVKKCTDVNRITMYEA